MSGVRAQLNLLVAATTSLVLIAFLVPIGLLLRRTAEQQAVAAATRQAQAVAALVAVGQNPGADPASGEPVMSVFYADGTVTGTLAPRTPSVQLAARGLALTAVSGDGIEVLLPVQGLPSGTAVVRAYVPGSLLHQGVGRTWLILAVLGLALFALGLLLADRLGRRLVGSVTALAATADRLAQGDLCARVVLSGVPELQRVGRQLNLLAARIGELLAAERDEVAALAHRLRTPTTALRLDIDAIGDPQERQRLSIDVNGLSRAVDELIRTARRPMREGVGARADLNQVAGERVRFWSALAQEDGREVQSVLSEAAVLVRASAEDLSAALDALLDNVFSHTPDGTALRVTVRERPGGGGVAVVEDAGPGLPTEDVSATPAPSLGSTGLGLDIARRTAESSGGSMSLGRSPLGGVRCELTFGAPA